MRPMWPSQPEDSGPEPRSPEELNLTGMNELGVNLALVLSSLRDPEAGAIPWWPWLPFASRHS